MDEMLGRATGLCGGRAGSMNVIDLDHGLIGSFGIIGGSMAAATGAALALRRTGGVAVAYFGDDRQMQEITERARGSVSGSGRGRHGVPSMTTATVVAMPRLSDSMEAGTVLRGDGSNGASPARASRPGDAARFLSDVKAALEEPLRLLV